MVGAPMSPSRLMHSAAVLTLVERPWNRIRSGFISSCLTARLSLQKEALSQSRERGLVSAVLVRCLFTPPSFFNIAKLAAARRSSSLTFARMAALTPNVVVVTTPVSGVSPTQTYTITASVFTAPAGATNAGAVVTAVPAYSVLLLSTAFEYPNVVIGLVAGVFVGASAPPPGATPPWDIPQRLTLVNLSLSPPVAGGPTPTDVQGGAVPLPPNTSLPTVGNGSATTTKGAGKASPSISSASSPGLSTGAAAGVAVGCLVAGALIAFAVAFFCLKRRRTKHYDDHSPTTTTTVSDLKGYHAPPPVPPPVADSSPLDKFLLDSTSDEEMAAELHALGTLIQSHAENNYHLGTVLVNKNTLSTALTQLGVQKGGSLRPSELASLALAPATRQAALQHVISQVVFTSVDTSARSQLSMLPSPVAAFLQSIPPPESGTTADGKCLHRVRL